MLSPAAYIAHVLRIDVDGRHGVPGAPPLARLPQAWGAAEAALTPESDLLHTCLLFALDKERALPAVLAMVPRALPPAIHPLAARVAYLLDAYLRAKECRDMASAPMVRVRRSACANCAASAWLPRALALTQFSAPYPCSPLLAPSRSRRALRAARARRARRS